MGDAISGWDISGGSVVAAPGSPYAADPNGYSLPHSDGIVSGDGKVVNIDLPLNDASELTWVQSGVTVSNATTPIAGRSGDVKAEGVANDNTKTVGVKSPAWGAATPRASQSFWAVSSRFSCRQWVSVR